MRTSTSPRRLWASFLGGVAVVIALVLWLGRDALPDDAYGDVGKAQGVEDLAPPVPFEDEANAGAALASARVWPDRSARGGAAPVAVVNANTVTVNASTTVVAQSAAITAAPFVPDARGGDDVAPSRPDHGDRTADPVSGAPETTVGIIAVGGTGRIQGSVLAAVGAFYTRGSPILRSADRAGECPSDRFEPLHYQSNDGLLEGVVVRIRGTVPGVNLPDHAVPVRLSECLFSERLLLVGAGGRIAIESTDSVAHELELSGRTTTRVGHRLTHSTPVVVATITTPSNSGIAEVDVGTEPRRLRLRCRRHGQSTDVLVTENPFVTRTDASGNYELVGVPPGTYRVEAGLDGKRGEEVIVGPFAPARVSFRL